MITLADVQAALERIRQSIYLSPCTLSATFSQLTGNSIYLKLDNLQRTGAFKERGALNKLLTMSDAGARSGRDCGFGRKSRAGTGLSRRASAASKPRFACRSRRR